MQYFRSVLHQCDLKPAQLRNAYWHTQGPYTRGENAKALLDAKADPNITDNINNTL